MELPKKNLGSKEHLAWLKKDLYAAEISTVQDYNCTKNSSELKYIDIVVKLRVRQVAYGSRYDGNTKAKAERKSARNLKNLCILPEIQQRALGSGESIAVTPVSIYENTPKRLPHLSPKSCCTEGAQLEVKVDVEATC